MKKLLAALTAALIPLVLGATAADAQRGHRGGGVVVVRGGQGPVFRGGAAFYRGPVVRSAYIGAPRHFYRPHVVFRPRPFVRYGFVGAYPVARAYVGGCQQWRLVPTPFGLQWRWVNVCHVPFVPVAYPYRYPAYHPYY